MGLGHHTDRSPVGLGQYDSRGEYCDPHTASSVFLILIFLIEETMRCTALVFTMGDVRIKDREHLSVRGLRYLTLFSIYCMYINILYME